MKTKQIKTYGTVNEHKRIAVHFSVKRNFFVKVISVAKKIKQIF